MERQDLVPQIISKLEQKFGMKLSKDGRSLRAGVCPDCSKKTLWTWAHSPGQIQCDRTNKCGFVDTSKSLFPEVFVVLTEKYPPTEKQPNATADKYLSLIRGFNISQIKGWYEQGKFWCNGADKGTATVRFYLTTEKSGDKSVMWERFIEDVNITKEGSTETRNKNFKGAFKGMWWKPTDLRIKKDDEIWFCEGILDAIALNLNGIKAVAIMSSGTFPSDAIKPYLNKGITWVLALDNDVTGRKCLQKHAQRLRDMGEKVSAAISAEGEEKADWNDLHKAKKLSTTDIQHYRYLGDLELAPSYKIKAQLMWFNQTLGYFLFDYKYRTYRFNMDKASYDKHYKAYWTAVLGVDNPDMLTDQFLKEEIAKRSDDENKEAKEQAFGQACKITEIATFDMRFLYFQQPDNDEDGQYFFRFRFSNQLPDQQLAFAGKTLSAAGDFKKSAMHKAPGALFTGSGKDMDKLYRAWISYKPKVVTTLDFIGYDKATKTYVMNEYAVEQGTLLKVNAESFFQLKKSGIKTTVDIKQTLNTDFNADWLADFSTAFGIKGYVALVWWFGSFFAEQVRDDYRSYPYLELVGPANSGKSDLVDFLWNLLGKHGESFNPVTSTLAGRTRKMAEVSNMPVVFNETDNEDIAADKHAKKFNWDEHKDLFDGEFGRVTGIKSQDNSTKKPKFKGALMAIQNPRIIASEAMISRFCHVWFDTSHHTAAGKLASDRLNMLPIKVLSGFYLHAVQQSSRVLKHFARQLKKHMAELQKNPNIKMQRIVENHAKMMAFADCLKGVLPQISEDTLNQVKAELLTMATKCQSTLNEDHEIVRRFWSQFEYINTKAKENGDPYAQPIEFLLNHNVQKDKLISINIEHFHSLCRDNGLPMIDPKELRQQLKTSRKPKYLRNEVVTSRLQNRSVRCWTFENTIGKNV